ncbi:hypothetical protein G6729_01700 [Polynucleobacter paneuropaeus]|nr:hypothetical protein G6729_01700 [Polynucleobacter paneuropaeus]
MKSKAIVAGLILQFYSISSYAYLDPASSSALLASSGSIIFILIIIFTNLIKFILGAFYLFNSKINIFYKWDLVVHIEYSGYYSSFERYLEINKNISMLLICPEGLYFELRKKTLLYKNVKICNANTLFIQSSVISIVRANFLITSTPGIGTRYFNKTDRIKRTAFMTHSASDVHSYNLISFDHFDVIYCPNEIIKNNIITILNKRGNFSIPKIYVVSLQYFVYLKNAGLYSKFQKLEKNSLLLAPSWGQSSFLTIADNNMLNAIVLLAKKLSLKLIFRPHPQSIASKEFAYLNAHSIFQQSNVDYELDLSDMPFEALGTAKLLLSDFSSIIYDYNFISEKPMTICYFNESCDSALPKEDIFMNIKSLEYSSYSENVIFCQDYLSLYESINKFDLFHPCRRINVEDLFLHDSADYLLNVNNV